MRKKPTVSIIIFIIGIITLVTGLVLLIVRLVSGPATEDGDFLVKIGEWALEGNSDCTENEETEQDCDNSPKVIWTFTEIGKGKLTTNGHLNDYDFIWAIEGGKLKIETDWLYQLNDEYDYKLDQSSKKLTLDDEIVFMGREHRAPEQETE